MNNDDVRKSLNSVTWSIWDNVGLSLWKLVDYAMWDDIPSSISRTVRDPVEFSLCDYFEKK